jgi:predicted regulator of Ras-like GTPase activity (Roadblock/LC7/MglB family)
MNAMREMQMSEQREPKQARWGGSLDALMGVPGVLAGMIATEDGLPLDARLRSKLDADALAAAAAVLGQLGSRVLQAHDSNGLDLVVLDASKYRFMVQPVALGYLMAVTDPQIAADPVATQMARSAEVLDQGVPTLPRPHAA